MKRKGIDASWNKVRAGYYSSNEGEEIIFQDGGWWAYDSKGNWITVFQTLKSALSTVWKNGFDYLIPKTK